MAATLIWPEMLKIILLKPSTKHPSLRIFDQSCRPQISTPLSSYSIDFPIAGLHLNPNSLIGPRSICLRDSKYFPLIPNSDALSELRISLSASIVKSNVGPESFVFSLISTLAFVWSLLFSSNLTMIGPLEGGCSQPNFSTL